MHHDAPAGLPLLAYVCGLTFGASLVDAPRMAALLLAAACLLVLSARRTRVPGGREVVLALLALAGGVAMADRCATMRHTESLAFAKLDETRFVDVEAPLDHDWSKRGDGYLLHVDGFRAGGTDFEQSLAIYARFVPPAPDIATTVHARGFLHRSDRGTFSLAVKSPRLLGYSGQLSRFSPARWNRALAARLEPLAAEYPTEVALAEAIALGRSERLTDEVRASFRRGGTYHLLVFSGLQIAAAAGFLAWLLRCLRAPRASDWLLLAFAVAAPLFIGPTASVSRASVAIALYALTRLLGRPTSLENLWCVAALARLVAAPADLTSPAFQLTYAGAGALLFVAKRRPLLVPLIAELAIAPLTLFHFHQYALGGSVVTLLMTPVVFLMLALSAVAFAVPSTVVLIAPLHGLCAALNDVGAATYGFHHAPPVAALVAGYGLSLAAVAFLRGERRALAISLALLVPTAAALAPVKHPGEEIIALDVGQGDSIVVRAGDKVILVDGGGRSGSASFGESTLLPLLVDRGIQHLDAVVLTHAHPDHCGGIPAVLDNLGVGEIWITPRRFNGECAAAVLASTIRSRTPIHLVHDGDRLVAGALHATAMLAPGPFRRSQENNCSIVLRVQIESHRLLLTGDIERDAEARIADRRLACDLLKVAHHGSRSSSTPPLLDAAAPRIALISAGRRNLFGHPHAEVLDALTARRIRVWRTDQSGTIAITLRGRQLEPSPEIDTPE